MRKEVKFPIAAVFSLLNVLIGLINIFYTFTRIGGMPTSTVVRASVWCIITLLSGILLTIVLFMRKRGALLWVPLGLELAIDLYYLGLAEKLSKVQISQGICFSEKSFLQNS